MDKHDLISAFQIIKANNFHEGSRLHQIILNMLNNRRFLKKTSIDCLVQANNIIEIIQDVIDAIDVFIDEHSESDNEESSESDNEESSESNNEESYEKTETKGNK